MTYDVAARTVKKLAVKMGGYPLAVACSPDGKRIAYLGANPNRTGPAPGPGAGGPLMDCVVMVADATGDNAKEVFQGKGIQTQGVMSGALLWK